jgi:RimJ/RimL family protein N-acetyltransferase
VEGRADSLPAKRRGKLFLRRTRLDAPNLSPRADVSLKSICGMIDWIETERTRLRPFEESDAEAAFAWFSDPHVMRFIPSGPDPTLAATRDRLASYRAQQARFGFSKWIILHRETGRPIGDSGLWHLPDGQRIELGFRLAPAWWGAGYATEVGRAWMAWFDAHRPGEPLFADVHPENLRSQRVLAKLGFEPSHTEVVFGMTMLILRKKDAA